MAQEKRGWDDEVTVSQREKEHAHDYRYFLEPDLPPIKWKKEDIREIKAQLPELPQSKRKRLKKEYKINDEETEILVVNKELGEYFEKCISELPSRLKKKELLELIKLTLNYLITDLQGLLKGKKVSDQDFLITPENFAEFIVLIHQGEISSKIAKILLPEMLKKGADPSHIIEEKNLSQITDKKEIEGAIKKTILENKKAVEDFQQGKKEAFQFLIGQVMAQTKGKASPETVKKVLKKILESL